MRLNLKEQKNCAVDILNIWTVRPIRVFAMDVKWCKMDLV